MRDFSMRVRVYIEDTDAGGVVFYANYLRYLERARTEALRDVGVDLVDWQVRHRRIFVVRSVRIDYLAPARLDDELTVHARIRTLSRTSLTLDQPVTRGDTRLVDASVTLVCVDADTLRAVRLPPAILAALDGAVPVGVPAGAVPTPDAAADVADSRTVEPTPGAEPPTSGASA